MSKKKIEVVKSTTEPNKNDIWFNGKEFKYFGKKGWQNIIKTSDIPAGDGTNSASGTSARQLYVDYGQGLTDEQKAYNAETFQMLKTTFLIMYVALPGFPPYIITSAFGIAPSDIDTSFPLNMIVVTSSYSMVVPIVLMADGSTSDLKSALFSAPVFSTAGLLNFSDESSDKSRNIANYEAYRGIRNQSGFVNISIKISSTQYFATGITPFVDYLEIYYIDYNNDLKKVHILPTGDIEDVTIN